MRCFEIEATLFVVRELFKIKLYIFRLSLFLNLEAHFFDIGHVFNIEINFLKIKKVKAFRGGILTFYSRSRFLSRCWRTLFDLGVTFYDIGAPPL